MKEKVELQGLLSELGRELQQAKADVGEERKAGQDLMAQLEVGVGGREGGRSRHMYVHTYLIFQEAKMSQEQLADQVVNTSEEKHKMTVELESLNKV